MRRNRKEKSNMRYDTIVSSWWRNQDYEKLKLLKKIQKLYEDRNQKISNEDLIQRVENLS